MAAEGFIKVLLIKPSFAERFNEVRMAQTRGQICPDLGSHRVLSADRFSPFGLAARYASS
jgi:hypothetical protein